MVLSFLVVFSLLAQGFAVFADTSLATTPDHPIIAEAIDLHAVTVAAEACCADELAENTVTPCNGGDCKLFFASETSTLASQADDHSAFLVVEEFSFQNVVRLRPPNA